MKTFEELGVSAEIRQAIEEMGYENPMPVQEEVIPYLLGNRNDVVALAQTGTGKTAAYLLPVLNKLSEEGLINAAGRTYPALITPEGEAEARKLLAQYGIDTEERRRCSAER